MAESESCPACGNKRDDPAESRWLDKVLSVCDHPFHAPPPPENQDEQGRVRCQHCDEPLTETYEGCGLVCKRPTCVQSRAACPECFGTGGCAYCCSTCGGDGERIHWLKRHPDQIVLADLDAYAGKAHDLEDEIGAAYERADGAASLLTTEQQARREAEERVVKLQAALSEAADDLGKAANQMEGLKLANRSPRENHLIFARKEARFARKEARARSALSDTEGKP